MPYIPPPDYSTIKKLARDKTFIASARRAIELKREISQREGELKELNEDVIEPTLKAAKLTNSTIVFEGVPVALRDVSSGFVLDESKLVLKGVSKKVIEQCKVEKARRHYVEYTLKSKTQKSKSKSEQRKQQRDSEDAE